MDDLSKLRVSVDARYLKRTGIGVPKYIRGLLDELILAGANLTLITDDHAHATQLAAEFPRCASVALPARSGFLWEQVRLPWHLCREAYDLHLAGGNYGLPLVRDGRTALVLVVHDIIPLRFPRAYLAPRPAWAVKYILSTVISVLGAEHIVAVSEHTRSDLGRYFRRRAVSVVYPEIPTPIESTEDIRLELPPRYFAYCGGYEWRKNFDTLLDAFALLLRETDTDAHLVVLGRGYDETFPIVTRLGIEERTTFLGYVPEETKNAVLASASALVYPSRYEGFGLPILEGLSAGVPVVCGTGSSLDEAGGQAVIRVDALNYRSLAEGMYRAISGDQAALSAAGYAQLEKLRAERVVMGFPRIVAEVVAGRRQRQRRWMARTRD